MTDVLGGYQSVSVLYITSSIRPCFAPSAHLTRRCRHHEDLSRLVHEYHLAALLILLFSNLLLVASHECLNWFTHILDAVNKFLLGEWFERKLIYRLFQGQ